MIFKRSRTIADKLELHGVGVHSGNMSKITLWPWDSNGLYLCCNCINDKKPIRINSSNYFYGNRTSLIQIDGYYISCPEHLFASLALAGIDSVLLEVQAGTELPSTPMNFRSYFDAFIDVGVIDVTPQTLEKYFQIPKITFSENNRNYDVITKSESVIEIILELPGVDSFGVELSLEPLLVTPGKLEDLARARTWVMATAYPKLLEAGLCRGANSDNCQIITEDLLREPSIRQECLLHKLFDLIGDLYLIDFMPIGKIKIKNPNHRLNTRLLYLLEDAWKIHLMHNLK